MTGKTPAEALGEAMEALSPEPYGVGVFEGMRAYELADGRLAVVPLDEGASFEFTPSLMHRKDRPLGRAGALFRELLIEQFQALE